MSVGRSVSGVYTNEESNSSTCILPAFVAAALLSAPSPPPPFFVGEGDEEGLRVSSSPSAPVAAMTSSASAPLSPSENAAAAEPFLPRRIVGDDPPPKPNAEDWFVEAEEKGRIGLAGAFAAAPPFAVAALTITGAARRLRQSALNARLTTW